MKQVRLLYNDNHYYVNSDMRIPNSLAVPYLMDNSSELARRIGLPPVNRLPYNSPLSMAKGSIPKRK